MVTAAKPKVGGAIAVGTSAATLPTATDTTTPTGFTSLGYISDSGLVRSTAIESTLVKAWGGDTVLAINGSKTETFKFAMLDSTSTDVLKIVRGDSNVTGTLADGITVKSNNTESASRKFVIDMIEANDVLHRICIPCGIVTAVGDVTYLDTGAISYEVTVTAIADASGNTCYEYIKTKASS